MILELEICVRSETIIEGKGSVRVLLFTYPIIRAYTDLLTCRRDRCDYRFAIHGYRSRHEIAFEVITDNVFVGLKEPILTGGHDSRTFNASLIEVSKRMSDDPIEYIKEAVEFVRESIDYQALKKRIGTHEALQLGLGDCEEYTDTLASLLAARGFKIRRIIGATTGGLHARLEYKAKDGSWVPIDPTRNEVGRLSKNHIPIFVGNKRPIKIPRKARLTRFSVRAYG